jgi:hypothetical protein
MLHFFDMCEEMISGLLSRSESRGNFIRELGFHGKVQPGDDAAGTLLLAVRGTHF